MYHSTRVFIAACAGMLLFGMTMLSLGTVNSFLVERFDLDQLGVGSLAALLPFGILAGSLVFGPIVDRLGYKWPLAVSTLLLSAGFFLVATAESFLPVQAAFFVIGFGGGVINGGANALVADISGEDRGAKLSLLSVFFGIGALGTPALTGLLLASLHESEIILGFSVAIALPLFYILAIRFPPPKQHETSPWPETVRIMKDRALWLLSFVLFFESAVESMANNWTPGYLQGSAGFSLEDALLMLTVLAASLTAGRLILGWAIRRISSRTILFVCLGLAVAGSLLLSTASTTVGASFAMVLLGLGTAAAFPVIFAFIAELFPALTGTAFGFALLIALSGNMLLNYGMGVASQIWGVGIFPYFLLASFIGVGAMLLPALRAYQLRSPSSRN